MKKVLSLLIIIFIFTTNITTVQATELPPPVTEETTVESANEVEAESTTEESESTEPTIELPLSEDSSSEESSSEVPVIEEPITEEPLSNSEEINSLEIIQQPECINANIGDVAIFTTKANMDAKYLWMRSKDNGVTWEKAFYDGYRTNEMSVPVKEWVYNYLFYCQIKDTAGNVLKTDIVKVVGHSLEITKQPVDAYGNIEDTISLDIEASGTGLKYLWMRSKDNGSTWGKAFYDGYKTNKMSIPIKSWVYGYRFYCTVTDAYGNSIDSDIVYVKEKECSKKIKLTCDDYSYTEQTTGNLIVSRDDFFKNATVDEYSLEYKTNNSFSFSNNDLFILRFIAFSENECGHVSLDINDQKYKGTFSLPVEKSEYYIPIKGITNISSIKFDFKDTEDSVYLSDVELINYMSQNVTKLKTGLFNIACAENTVLYENQALAPASEFIEIDGNYLYSGRYGILKIFDKSNMNVVSTLKGLGATRDLEFYGDYLIISSRENGIYFVDRSDIKNPKIISHYDTLELSTGIAVYDHYLFACSRMFGTEIIDIDDIYNPKFVSNVYSINEEYYDCCVNNGYLYVSVWAQKRIEIYSLDDVAKPKVLSTIKVDGECAGIVVKDNILYVATGYNGQGNATNNCSPGYGFGNGMEIYDVSDAKNPKWLSSSKIDGRYRNAAFDHWKIRVAGNYAYFTNILNGVYIYDISNPNAPKRIDHVTIYIDKKSRNYHKINQGSFLLPYDTLAHGQGMVSGIALDNGALYIGDAYSGIYKYQADYIKHDITPIGSLSITSKKLPSLYVEGENNKLYVNNSSIYAVAKNNDYIYLANGDAGVTVLNNQLENVASIKTSGAVRDIKIVGDYIFTAENDAGLGIYKISEDSFDKINQVSPSYYNTCFSNIEVNSDEDILFIQAGWGKIAIYNIESKENPQLIEIFSTTSNMYYKNLASGIAENNLFAFSDSTNAYVYKIDKSGQRQCICSYYTNVWDRDGVANYYDKFILINKNGYFIVDKNTGTSSDVITVPKVQLRGKVAAKDGIMVVCNQYTGHAYVLDITDINKPTLLKDITVDGNPDVPTIIDNEIYIPCRNSGVVKIVL